MAKPWTQSVDARAATVVDKYLRSHAHIPPGQKDAGPARYVAIVPACGETETLPRCLAAIERAAAGQCHVIVVVNAHDQHPPTYREQNQTTLHALADLSHVTAVDCTSPGCTLSPDQGVGLARKIGCDLALRAIQRGLIEVPRLYMTDADAVVPVDFFSRPTFSPGSRAGALFPFRHQSNPEDLEAVTHYDAAIRLYALGLQWAGSPYAYVALGSTLCLDAGAYAQVRGFPLRAAGEDFHLLAKLCKVAPLERLDGAPVVAEGRRSDRVPFGTGPAVAQQLRSGEPWPTYHPAIYEVLARLLFELDSLADGGRQALSPQMAQLFDGLGFTMGLHRALAQRKGVPARRRAVHEWFDALKTLRFVHALRDQDGYASMDVTAAVEHPFFSAHIETLTAVPDVFDAVVRGPCHPGMDRSGG